jgi:hypothetical protein
MVSNDDDDDPYEWRIVVPDGPTDLDRELAEDRARAILEDLSFSSRFSASEGRRLATAALGLAKISRSRALQDRAREALACFPYTKAERLAVIAKARATLERLKGKPSYQGQAAVNAHDADANQRRLAGLIAKLARRTVQNGCTPAEAAAARATIERLRRVAEILGLRLGRPDDEQSRVRAWLKSQGCEWRD